MRCGLLLACVLSCLVLAGTSAFAQRITALGLPPGASWSEVAGVSADGSRVALSSIEGARSGAWLWSAQGGLERLGPVLAWEDAYAHGISGDGSTVVGAYSPWFPGPGFRWSAATGYEQVTTDDVFGDVEVLAVSHDGQHSVGSTAAWASDQTRAVRWTPAGMQYLGVLPGMTHAEANGISADGSIIIGRSGTWASGGPARAFRWTEQGGMQDIGAPAGFASAFARAISAEGATIVGGSYGSPTSWEQACVWSNGVVRNLDAPVGYNMATALGVNADGAVIVGATTYLDEMGIYEHFHATIWTEALGHRDLEEYLGQLGLDMTGWDLHYARGVSADGSVIVGDGYYNGVYQGWIVNIPSPGAVGLVGCGVFIVGRRRRASVAGC